jgi:glycosyltransferase involved in cell wall biosynthesis
VPRPLRVAVLARAVMPLHGIGGLERSVHDLVRHLAARGVGVTLVVPPPAPVPARQVLTDPFASPHIRVRHVPYLSFPFANRRGTTILDRSTAYLLYGQRAGRLADRLARQGEVDVIHGFGASLLGAARSPAAAPLVLNPQGLEEFGATATRLPLLKRAGYLPLRWAVRRVARAADRIIATDAALEPMVIRHLRPRDGQMCTIPNGIDLVDAASLAGPADGPLMRQRHGIGAGELVLVSAGRLEFNKGFDVLAAALARAAAPDSRLAATGWRWVIVGDGPFRRTIEQALGGEGLASHVIFTGRASDRDLHAWYEAASLFVHPTRYEGSSLVTLEAMAHRRPIIATRAGGLPDKVRPGVNGWLVDPDDADGLAQAIGEAASAAARLPEMGAASRQIVEREFAWPILADQHIAMYETLLAGVAGRSPAAT